MASNWNNSIPLYSIEVGHFHLSTPKDHICSSVRNIVTYQFVHYLYYMLVYNYRCRVVKWYICLLLSHQILVMNALATNKKTFSNKFLPVKICHFVFDFQFMFFLFSCSHMYVHNCHLPSNTCWLATLVAVVL